MRFRLICESDVNSKQSNSSQIDELWIAAVNSYQYQSIVVVRVRVHGQKEVGIIAQSYLFLAFFNLRCPW